MQRTVIFYRHKLKRQFVVSNKTKPNNLRTLVKKALNLQTQIKYFRYQDAHLLLEDIISSSTSANNQYQIVLEDDSDEQRSRSEVCSQKNMSKVSGRQNPPSQKELLQSKFYVDDFQLFMSQVSGNKENKLFGIVFFNNRKKASFLGKKILRELIFEFDYIQFFYALHPIKMHTSSALLGDLLVFSLFRGKKMIHERQFPEQITAADQILNYLKTLIKLGDIDFSIQQYKRPKNLIQTQQQRSFDHQIETSPEKLSDFGGKPNRTTALIKVKPITPDKEIRARRIFTNPKPDSPSKSHITNEISFQNDLFQPEWFTQGNSLNRLEKGFLAALIKGNDSNLLNFLQGLNLKASGRQQLNIKLVKVFLKEAVEERLKQFTDKEILLIQHNQQNRKSFVFNALLKLQKFGDLRDFADTLSKGLRAAPPIVIKIPQLPIILKQNVNYSDIARKADKNKTGFSIKLLDCEDENEHSFSESISPFRQNNKMRFQHVKIATLFHSKELKHVPAHILKDIQISTDFSEAERAGICDLILKNDAFMIENFVKNPERSRQKLPSKHIKKYLREVESRYDQIRQRTVVDKALHLKMQKLQIFHGLVYFLYKHRVINKKQLKISFYLYSWSDLNILAAFEVYLEDRSIEQFVDTIYSIDYNYYLNNLYEIEHSEVVQFTLQIQSQLIILFLYENFIQSGDQRISLQKFIRAGDDSLIKIYLDISNSQDQVVRRMVALGKAKKEVLQNLASIETFQNCKEEQKKKDRCGFLDQIVATRYKGFTKKDMVKYCIHHNQPQITSLFDRLDQHNQQSQFVQSFNSYVDRIDEIHKELVLVQLCKQGGIEIQGLKSCRQDIIHGIYEVFLQTDDKADTIDSLQRTMRKTSRSVSPR